METDNGTFRHYLSLFKGREDYFAEQYYSYYRPIPRPLDTFYLNQHLNGDATYGVYVLTKGSCCHFFCIDIDIPKSELKEVDFTDRTIKYAYLGKHLKDTMLVLTERLRVPQEALLLEDTGGRGYHIWIFVADAISGNIATNFGEILKKNLLPFEIEFFPKQGELTSKRKLGNLVKLPLGMHRKYANRSIFFTLPNNEPKYLINQKDCLELLIHIKPVEASAVLETVNDNPVTSIQVKGMDLDVEQSDLLRPLFKGDLKTLTTRCEAIKRLRSKAESGKELSRSEAFHFTNILLSVADQGLSYVVETMQASYGSRYDEEKTLDEIEKIRHLFPTSCAKLVQLGICPGYCREGIRRRNTDPLLRTTIPCGVWLTRIHGDTPVNVENLNEQIGEPKNIRRSFFQLKVYHEYEDSLFFDPFDFEQYERDFSSNCEVIAAILREKQIPPFAGYLTVEIPKKLDNDFHLVHRKMAYSTVNDQIPIQAVFNIVAPLIEHEFLNCSFGYRWNSDKQSLYRIFNDWREAYPRFRGQILTALHSNPNGFHICCDIKGYYEHVQHEIIVEQLRTIIRDDYIIKFLSNIISMYQHETGEARGLPQGPAYARVLANLYLNDFDKFAIRISEKYLRYVDDLFFFFTSKEDAERGLQDVVKYLSGLGLALSEADDKKPIITANTDESRVRQSLDKIQYGILDEARQLKHLDSHVVSAFYDALGRHKASPENLDELLELNDYMPSLLYVVTKEALILHPLRGQVWAIVKYLISHHWFYPKRLKKIFYRLLDLGPSDAELIDLYDLMEPAHKVYFILSVYGTYLLSGNHKGLLEQLTERAVHDGYEFLRGFGLAIGIKLELRDKLELASVTYIQRLTDDISYFSAAKWVSMIPYLSLSDEERTAVRQLVNSGSKSLLKRFVLENLGGEPQIYLDGRYLCNLIAEADPTLFPAMCSIFISTTNKSDLFSMLLEILITRPALKKSVISILSTKLFDLRAGAGTVQIENLRELYSCAADAEIKAILLDGLHRIAGDQRPYSSGIDFAKCHQQLAKYNECFLFQHIGQPINYDGLELIPLSRLQQYVHHDLDSLKNVLEDLGEKEVLPPLKFIYYAETKEVCLELKIAQGLKPVSKVDFHADRVTTLCAMRLAVQVYKKAAYLRSKMGKVPFIHSDNLLVNENYSTIMFRTIGMNLCSPYLIDGTTVGDEEENIPRMVGLLLAHLLVGDSRAVQEFEKKPHTGLEAFLDLFIKNMSIKIQEEPYSCSRFEYIVEKLVAASSQSDQQVAALYMRERLKSSLFRRNSQRISWYGIAGTVSDHVYHLYEIYSRESVRAVAYRDRLAIMPGLKKKLHWISRQLLNLTMNHSFGPISNALDPVYTTLLKCLLHFSILSIEVLTLYRSVQRGTNRHVPPLIAPQDDGTIHVSAAGYERTYESLELTIAMRNYSAELACSTTTFASELSLSQMMLQILLSFNVSVNANFIKICKNVEMPESVFRPFAHACLVRVPRIEEELTKMVGAIFDALQSNDDIVISDTLESLHEDLLILTRDFEHFRKYLHISRRFGVASGQRYFPPDIICKQFLRRTIIAKEPALPGAPLISKLPVHKYRCSWDLYAGSMVSLIVPDDGLNTLLSDLITGRLCGFKFSYLYSGKAMLFYDGLFAFVSFVSLAACEYGKTVLQDHSGWISILSAGSIILGTAFASLIGKLAIWDLIHWIPSWKLWIKSLHKADDKESDAHI